MCLLALVFLLLFHNLAHRSTHSRILLQLYCPLYSTAPFTLLPPLLYCPLYSASPFRRVSLSSCLPFVVSPFRRVSLYSVSPFTSCIPSPVIISLLLPLPCLILDHFKLPTLVRSHVLQHVQPHRLRACQVHNTPARAQAF